tara:strand:+ start:755 stop:1306 length:552 start_codon:yes stop_codon:yes gene_type:complete
MKYENSWTQPGEGFLKELKLNEIDFASADALKSYKSKHTMRPDTVVNVAGKKTKAVDVLGKDAFKDDEKGDGDKQSFKSQRKNDTKDIERDIKGNGGSLGGFSLNFASKEDEKEALRTVTNFAKKNGIEKFGSKENKGMGSAKGRTQIYIQNNDTDVADLFRALAKDGEVVGKSVSGMDYKGK